MTQATNMLRTVVDAHEPHVVSVRAFRLLTVTVTVNIQQDVAPLAQFQVFQRAVSAWSWHCTSPSHLPV